MVEGMGADRGSRPPISGRALFDVTGASRADIRDRHLEQMLSSTGPAVENLRRLRFGEGLSSESGRLCLGVTAPVVGDGASSIALGLAAVSARDIRNRVLVVEASLREPALEGLLGIERLPGLVEWLEGGGDGPVTLRTVDPWGFFLLPAGGPSGEAVELLSSESMKRLLDQARASFDLVIVDCPALETTADTVTIQELLDGLLVVVRERHASQKMVQKTTSDLRPELIRGVVLNARTDTFVTRWFHRRRSRE